MNWFIIGFFLLLLTGRFFSETLAILPKATDLVDLLVIPLLLLYSLAAPPLKNIDSLFHQRMFRLVISFFVVAAISYAVNLSRVFYAPALLFVFGIIEGPLLFLALNRVIRNKHAFGTKMSKFIGIMVVVEAGVVLFINLPQFMATGNPDHVSGTFGFNPYQFSAFLIIMGGFFLGRMRISNKSIFIGLAIQLFIVGTFILLQWRTAVPSFFLSYLVLVVLLYGRRILRLALVGGIALIGIYMMFSYVQSSSFDLKYNDLLVVFQNPGDMANIGKVLAYANTLEMFSEYPAAILVGTGPGTYVSRANYLFSIEAAGYRAKGVGPIIRSVFGEVTYRTEVQDKYIMPLYEMEILFGSMQVNNPSSSFLAVVGELGMLGVIVVWLIYSALIKRSISFLRTALSTEDPLLVPLASALVVGAVYLVTIAPLDSYLEIGRVTLPVWILFWTVSVLVKMRKVERDAAFAQAMYEAELAAVEAAH